LFAARERARRGDRDAAIPVVCQAVDELHQAGRPFFGVWGTGVLVETLLERGAEGDISEAQEAIGGWRTYWQTTVRRYLRSRCCGCARCWRGHVVTRLGNRDYRDRYRRMAESLGFEGHIALAQAMK
jgi:hypothetical protein